MLIRCCNSKCKAPFHHREGRLIRFSRVRAKSKTSDKQTSIEHFWLCGTCARLFVFECGPGSRVKIKSRNPGPPASAENLSPLASTV